MIAIINKGPINGAGPEGLHRYDIHINTTLITGFEHTRRDGLAVCLRKAADAVDFVNKNRVKQ